MLSIGCGGGLAWSVLPWHDVLWCHVVSVAGVAGQKGQIMKMLKLVPLAMALAVSLVAGSSASAANWDPQGTPVTATQVGTGVFTAGLGVSCTFGDMTLTASGATASGPSPTFDGCTGPLGLAATARTFGTWHFTAVDTTNVTVTATPGANGLVGTISIGSLCHITIPGPVTITGNDWNNSTTRFTSNSTVGFPVVDHGSCPGATTTGFLHTTFQLGSGAKIT